MQSPASIIGIIVLVLVVIGGGYWYMQQPTETATPVVETPVSTTPPTPVTENPSTETPASGYTLADIATHNGRASCWSAINGNVYDLTSWIDRHPGGAQRILSICGKDGSSAFSNQHEGEPKPETMLASFKLGVLK
jgi:cytochrome b involved in lipid metabolism